VRVVLDHPLTSRTIQTRMWDEMMGSKGHKPRGRHPHQRLSAVRVRNLTEAGRYADGNGLYLFVEPSGAKRWILRTVVAGKRRDIGLGSAQLVPLADARVEAATLRRSARAGGNPLAERRRKQRVVQTFKEAALKVHSAHAETFRNAKHKAQWIASVKADVFPTLGDRPVDAIDTSDVLKTLAPIWTTKPETARRLMQRMRVIFEWARASGHRSGDNPVDGVTKVLPKQRQAPIHHAALPYAGVPAFVKGLRAADAGVSTKLAFEFLILTAARTNEVLGARWEQIDRTAKTWTIPSTRIKAGREHRVPLSLRCLDLLESAEAIGDGGPYVFPGRTPKTPLSNMVFLMLLRRLGHDGITAHGFRSTFRDWAADRTNVPRSVCEAALAHVVKDKAEAAYFRSDLFDLRRSLMDKWSAFVNTTTASVLPIRA